MKNILFVLNDPPYGAERSYNALRLARNVLKKGEGQASVRVFLFGDAAACAKAGQKVPAGFYNIGDMLGMVARAGGEIAVCGTCMEARGLGADDLIEGAHRGTLDELTAWTLEADQTLVF